MKFKYKFESIKRIKETLEKKVQKEIGEIDIHLRLLLAEVEKLENTIKALHLELESKTCVKVAEIQHMSKYEEYLEEKIKNLEEDMLKLETQRSEKIEELKQKQKEHKIFEALETKKFEEFRIEENRLEQLTIDEIATQKFIRGES